MTLCQEALYASLRVQVQRDGGTAAPAGCSRLWSEPLTLAHRLTGSPDVLPLPLPSSSTQNPSWGGGSDFLGFGNRQTRALDHSEDF